MYPGSLMASAPCSYTATFSRARRTSQYLRPSRAPTTWSLRTSWTTTAGDRKLGMAGDRVLGMVSTRRRTTTPPACSRSYAQDLAKVEEQEFDVASPVNYNNFQEKFVLWMRNMLSDVAPENIPPWIPRLPLQVDAPALMNLTLLAGEKNVTLSVRTDNLYVVGFRNREGRWFELRHDRDRAPMIPGSTILRFDGRYEDQGGIGELSTGDAILGRGAVVGAIEFLSSFKGTSIYNGDIPHPENETDRKLKVALRVLIVNYIESVRFDTIAGRVATQMRNPSEVDAQAQLKKEEILLIRNWGGLSHALIQAVNSPDPALREHYWRRFNSAGIPSLVHAGRALGMVLVSTAFTSSARNAGAIGGGLTLAEVVGVVINGKLDGTITVNDGFGVAWKLNNHTKWVRHGWEANLAYPPRPISGADDFVIDVNLNRRVQVAVWNPRDALSGDYNRILKGQVTGEYGHVKVRYAVLTDAVVAVVEVVVVDANVKVYGSVTATTATASREKLRYSLLDKGPSQSADAPKNTAIPLQRKLFSAPLCSPLEVSAVLRDQRVPDREMANVFKFQPRRHGTDTDEKGKVRVKVTWSAYFSGE